MGRITSWHRGGGARKIYRLIDFKRKGVEASGVVERLEYDPNRSARIALVRHNRGEASFSVPFRHTLSTPSSHANELLDRYAAFKSVNWSFKALINIAMRGPNS